MQSEKLSHKMHSNLADNVSVDAFKKTKPGRGHSQPGGCCQGGSQGGG